jgi:hypothetical protein
MTMPGWDPVAAGIKLQEHLKSIFTAQAASCCQMCILLSMLTCCTCNRQMSVAVMQWLGCSHPEVVSSSPELILTPGICNVSYHNRCGMPFIALLLPAQATYPFVGTQVDVRDMDGSRTKYAAYGVVKVRGRVLCLQHAYLDPCTRSFNSACCIPVVNSGQGGGSRQRLLLHMLLLCMDRETCSFCSRQACQPVLTSGCKHVLLLYMYFHSLRCAALHCTSPRSPGTME